MMHWMGDQGWPLGLWPEKQVYGGGVAWERKPEKVLVWTGSSED